MKNRRIAHLFLIISAFIIQFSGVKASETPDTIRLDEFFLDEVTIRSPKETGRLNELPLSVSLVSFNRPENSSITRLTDLSALVPNFFMPDYGSRLTSPVYIRGIGSRINSPSVGLYVDNIPYFEKSAYEFDFYEIERIEVLRGPQGTLYGRNTMGGIINIFTRSPMEHQGTKLFLSGGNYTSLSGNLSHYGKINDNLAFSLSGNYSSRDGYFTNYHTGEKADDLRSAGARLRLVYNINSDTRAEITSSYDETQQGGYPYALFNENSEETGEVRYNRYSSYDRDMLSNALFIEHDRKGYIISSTTSHHYSDDLQSIDQDFTAGDLFFVVQDERQRMLSQEIIARSNRPGTYNWLFGTSGFFQNTDRVLDIEYGEDFLNAYNIPVSMADKRIYEHSNSGAALFHQSRLDGLINEKIALTAGIRVDYEKSDLNYSAVRYLNDNPAPSGEFKSSLDFLALMPRFSISYGFRPGQNAYITIARGYKTGGFNVTFERDEDRSFEPEYSWNYEAGMKMRMFESRAFVNASFFVIDWTNQQIYQPVASGQGAMLKNAGESVSRGAELEVRVLPHYMAEILLGYGFTDAVFSRHIAGPGLDYSGNFIPYVPRHTFNSGSKIRIATGSQKLDEMFLYLNYQFIGKHYWNEQNTHFQDGYGVFNLKLSFIRKGLQLDLWGKNITNNEFHSFFFQALGNSYVQRSKPLLFGVNIGLKL